ncbi:hypothetical protein [Bacillus sp. FJAT-50079]|uniref:hypothetical protein n=1 Tax=Bacillus sp. FJAT-50079 TaxID=2833577 RepID=UPI001BC99916|nr:hypothetical protein [Bacillus sp. FJAT-50079]MBS4207828.1 hypothetical protein [Bacillus sp. FJAT-50079]
MKKSLKEILAPMSGKERVNYIWHYYKFHMIGVIVLVVIASTTINGIINKKDVMLNIMIVGEKMDTAKIEDITEKINVELLNEKERDKYEISIQAVPFSTTNIDPQMQVGLQKMAAELAGGFIDVLLVEKSFFDEMNLEGNLLDIKELSGAQALPYQDDQIYMSEDERVTGIHASAIKLFENAIYDENVVLCIPGNTKNEANVSTFLSYMVEEK